MTSQALSILTLIGITVGLFWLGLCWVAAFGGRLRRTINPLWYRIIHEIYGDVSRASRNGGRGANSSRAPVC
jgi:hypothetical protein